MSKATNIAMAEVARKLPAEKEASNAPAYWPRCDCHAPDRPRRPPHGEQHPSRICVAHGQHRRGSHRHGARPPRRLQHTLRWPPRRAHTQDSSLGASSRSRSKPQTPPRPVLHRLPGLPRAGRPLSSSSMVWFSPPSCPSWCGSQFS